MFREAVKINTKEKEEKKRLIWKGGVGEYINWVAGVWRQEDTLKVR